MGRCGYGPHSGCVFFLLSFLRKFKKVNFTNCCKQKKPNGAKRLMLQLRARSLGGLGAKNSDIARKTWFNRVPPRQFFFRSASAFADISFAVLRRAAKRDPRCGRQDIRGGQQARLGGKVGNTGRNNGSTADGVIRLYKRAITSTAGEFRGRQV